MVATAKHVDFGLILSFAGVFSVVVVSSLVLYSASYSNSLPGLSKFRFSSSSFCKQQGDFPQKEEAENEEAKLRKVLESASMPNKTVILTTLNEAWAEPNSIFDVFMESFVVGNDTLWLTKHLLIVAVDPKAYARCLDYRLHCYFLQGQSGNFSRLAQFMSPTYMEMMWKRQEFLSTVLSMGYNYVFTDTDIMWLRNPFPYFYQEADLQISCDRFNGNSFDMRNPTNNGFSFARSNNRTIQFYKFWVSSRKTFPGLHEQAVLDKIKHDPFTKQLGLKMRFLDTNYFGGFCQKSKDFNHVCTMHANCCVGLDKKIYDLKLVLEDWKMYMSLSPSQRAREKFHWRSPMKC